MVLAPHIAVVDPAVRIPELDSYNNIARRSALKTTYHLPAMFGLESLVDAGTPTAIIIMGSGASVYDGQPWQQPFNDWLKPLMDQGIPTLGLCYGHQLIAHLYGGKVGYVFPDQTKLKGFRAVTLHSNRFWSTSETAPLVVSHRETVTTIPPQFQVAASSPLIPSDGLVHETLPIWTFQTHPEATAAFLRHGDIPWSGNPADFAFGHRIVQAFLEYVKKAS